eukprot:COSAG05_NODE_1973_length_3765_cov_7114.990998_5_plen_198_part_00
MSSIGYDGSECKACSSVAGATTLSCSSPKSSRVVCAPGTSRSTIPPTRACAHAHVAANVRYRRWCLACACSRAHTCACAQSGLSLVDNSATHAESDACIATTATCIANHDGLLTGLAPSTLRPFPAAAGCVGGLSPPAVLPSAPCSGSACTAAECCDDDDYCQAHSPCTGVGSSCVDLPAPDNYTCTCTQGTCYVCV